MIYFYRIYEHFAILPLSSTIIRT